MTVIIEGDQKIANEVLAQIEIWDQIVLGQKKVDLNQYCASDVILFDVSTQHNSVKEYKAAWDQFKPFMMEGMQISRRDITICASDGLAVIHCHSKVENPALEEQLQIPWCRTTLCMQKRNGQWYVVHQHISMPVDLTTGKAIVLKDHPKLQFVV